MSEVQSRPTGSRGRGSFRGSRGGFRGGRGGSKPHKSEDQENIPPSSVAEQGEVGELKKKYGSKVSTLRELFPDWSDDDLVYALKETEGDLESAIDRMSSGSISQWQENKKKHPKSKEAHSSTGETSTATRGGRGRGGLEGRGRGRGTERGRGGRGGRTGPQTNGTRSTDTAAKTTSDGWGDTPVPAADTTSGWENSAAADGEIAAAGDWATDAPNHVVSTTTAAEPKGDGIPTGKVLGWNKLFEKPKPAPVAKNPPLTAPAPQHEAALPPSTVEETTADERLPAPPTDPLNPPSVETSVNEAPEPPPSEPTITLTPSKDELTETNLEQLPDTSHPLATTTAASTTASTQDPRNASTNNIPAVRPAVGVSGYAANAARATSGAGRAPNVVRRVMEQQEAVVMPANHAVDRTAVQFGSMGLNGSAEALDVDEDREEPMTRTPLQDDSPVAPRASLPPAPAPAQAPSEHPPAPRQAPGLPPAPVQSNSPQQTNAYTDQFARYGQSGQKAYDPFGQQHVQQTQPPSQPQVQAQEPLTNQTPSQPQQVTSSAPNDYSSYYSATQQRDAGQAAYQNYYGGYSQTQDVQQRSGSAFGSSGQDTQSQYATSRPQPNYGQQEAQNSGNNTPNPAMSGQQTQPSQQIHQGQSSAQAGYPYGYSNAYSQQYPQYGTSYMSQMGNQQHRYGQHRPMYDDVRRQGEDYYMSQNSQYGYGHGQQYANAPYNKSSMYGQPQHQYTYEHSASPANAGGFGQTSMAGREAIYGRTGSAQPSEAQQGVGTPFGGITDPFARTHSGFGAQAQPMSQQHSGHQGAGGEPTKDYEAGKTGGPSPSIPQANRPGSATNMPGQQQGGQAGGFPAAQTQQAGQNAFGGSYPQYSGLGSFGGHPQAQNSHHQQSTGYGSYGGGAAFSSYGGYGSGRGWNGNYTGGH